MSLPSISLPSVSLPSVSLPSVSLPSVSLPSVSLPSISRYFFVFSCWFFYFISYCVSALSVWDNLFVRLTDTFSSVLSVLMCFLLYLVSVCFSVMFHLLVCLFYLTVCVSFSFVLKESMIKCSSASSLRSHLPLLVAFHLILVVFTRTIFI